MLTVRQKSFVDHYVTCRNGAEAARRAGYSAHSARIKAAKLLTNANIKAELQRLQELSAKHFELSREVAVQGLLDSIALAVEQRNPQAQIAGWREIGKMLGFYEPEKHVVALSARAEKLRSKYEAMSTEELMELAVAC